MGITDKLGHRERMILDIVYAAGKVTAGDVLTALPDQPSRTTVRTQLRILEEKGLLKHTIDGREYVYRPTRPKSQVGRSAMQRVVETFFNGSVGQAMANYLADPKTQLSSEEIEHLSKLIHQTRKHGE